MAEQKLYKIKFPTKYSWAYVFIPPSWVDYGHQRFAIIEIMHWNKKLGSFRAERYQKYQLYRKMLQSKVVQN